MLNQKTDVEILLSSYATTTTPTASKSVAIGHMKAHSLYLHWTPGAQNDVLTVTVQFTDEPNSAVTDANAKWSQDGVYTLGSAHYTAATSDITSTAANTTEVNMPPFNFSNTLATRFRILASETANPGVLSAKLLSRPV